MTGIIVFTSRRERSVAPNGGACVGRTSAPVSGGFFH